jgi:hypothetical protein
MGEPIKFSSSLFPQYDIDIDGQIFHLKAIHRGVFETLADITRKALAGDIGAVPGLYDQVALMIDAPKEYIDGLDYRLIRQIIKFVNEKIIQVEESEETKNGSGPGPGQ